VADRHRVHGILNVAERLLAGFDAVDEVAVDAAWPLGRHGQLAAFPVCLRRAVPCGFVVGQ
jgi:hypothetical protein